MVVYCWGLMAFYLFAVGLEWRVVRKHTGRPGAFPVFVGAVVTTIATGLLPLPVFGRVLGWW